MILAAVCAEFAAVVGDRLISLQNSRTGTHLGDHDTVSNKLLIVRYVDATVVIGYSGNAYIEGIPTDHWLAQAIAETAIDANSISHPIPPPDRPLAASLFQLRSRLRTARGADKVAIVVAGFRQRRGRTIPVLLRLDATADGKENFLGMRHCAPGEVRVFGVGVPPAADLLRNAMAPFQRHDRFEIGVDDQAAIFSQVIRDTARENKGVGTDLTEITLSVVRNPPVVVRFLPANPDRSQLIEQVPRLLSEPPARPDMITPWMLSRETAYPPTVFSGGGPATYRISWVEVQVVAAGGAEQSGNLSISPMKRKPPH
jgi:hypothetical protein